MLHKIAGLPPSVSVASLQKIGLRPLAAPVEQESKQDHFHYQVRSAKTIAAVPLEPEIEKAFERAKRQIEQVERSNGPRAPQPGDDVIVTTLGTGSAMPSKYRNGTNSALYNIPE